MRLRPLQPLSPLQRHADGGDPTQVLHDWIGQATAQGASLLTPPRQEPFGVEAWLLDPEGNRLLLLVQA